MPEGKQRDREEFGLKLKLMFRHRCGNLSHVSLRTKIVRVSFSVGNSIAEVALTGVSPNSETELEHESELFQTPTPILWLHLDRGNERGD
jgi:hypothetical protein